MKRAISGGAVHVLGHPGDIMEREAHEDALIIR